MADKVGQFKTLTINTTEPFKLFCEDMEFKKIVVMVGENNSGKTFILINIWCLGYITNAVVMANQSIPGVHKDLDRNAITQFCYDHSFSDLKMHGTVSCVFESRVKTSIKFDNGKVVETKITGLTGNESPDLPIFMSSQMRTFEAISMYLKLRKMVGTTDQKTLLTEMLKNFKLYDVMYLEKVIARMPRTLTTKDLKFLKRLDMTDKYEEIGVDLEKCDFYVVFKGERKYLTTFGSGVQALFNMWMANL